MKPIFITGIGTGIGKTLVSAIIAEALAADYWKPVQAGFTDGTDSLWLREMVSNPSIKIHAETYLLKLPASPHIAAREEGKLIAMDRIELDYKKIQKDRSLSIVEERPEHLKDLLKESPSMVQLVGDPKFLLIEGAGGLLSPLNENEFVINLIKRLEARVILVSRNYLGSINHSLLTAMVCRQNRLEVAGWVFNDQYMEYEHEIVRWSKFPRIASVPFSSNIDKGFIAHQARVMRPFLLNVL